jgi:hypothetical protein
MLDLVFCKTVRGVGGRSFPFVEAQRLLVAIRIVTEEVLLIDGPKK